MAIWARQGITTPRVSLAARLIVGAVLIVAGLANLGDPAGSVEAVQTYQILPGNLATLWGYGQPALEIMLGVLLLFGLATRLVAVITGLLLIAFIGSMSAAWARGLSIQCGCFGGGGTLVPGHIQYPTNVLRDVGLLALTVIVIAWPAGTLAVDHLLGIASHRPGRPIRDADSAEMRVVQQQDGRGT